MISVNKLVKNEGGTIIILFAILLPIIISIMGLVIDFGLVFRERSNLQELADNICISGAQKIHNGNSKVNNVVNEILVYNGEVDSLKSVNIVDGDTAELEIKLSKRVNFVFIKIFGFKSIDISVESTANSTQIEDTGKYIIKLIK